MRGFIPVLIAGVVAVPHAVGAQVPPVVGFDGVLFTSEQCCGFSYEGPVTFRLCDVPEGACVLGGGPAWEETHEAGVVDGGYLHADLGAQVALPPAAFAGPRWLEVELSEGIGVLSPRVALTAVPYAWQCLDASTLGGKAAGDFSPASHAHPWSSVTDLPATLADGKVSWDEVVGPPPTFPPAGHVHVIPEVTGLQAALDGKAAAGHDHDGRYYPKHEVDVLLAGKEDVGTCYTTAQVDERIAGLVATDDARLLSADQKAQLTSGGVTALHSHPASPLEYNTLVNAMNLTKLSAATAKPIEGYRNFLYETFSSNTASETSNLWYDSTNKCYRPFDCSRYFVDLEANTLDPTKFAYGTLWVAPRPDAWRVYPPDGDTYETGRARVLAALFDGTGGSALTWPNAKQVTGIWTSEPRDVGRRAYRLRLRVAGTSVPGGANPSIAATGLFDGTTANPGVSSWVGLSKTANHYASLSFQMPVPTAVYSLTGSNGSLATMATAQTAKEVNNPFDAKLVAAMTSYSNNYFADGTAVVLTARSIAWQVTQVETVGGSYTSSVTDYSGQQASDPAIPVFALAPDRTCTSSAYTSKPFAIAAGATRIMAHVEATPLGACALQVQFSGDGGATWTTPGATDTVLALPAGVTSLSIRLVLAHDSTDLACRILSYGAMYF